MAYIDRGELALKKILNIRDEEQDLLNEAMLCTRESFEQDMSWLPYVPDPPNFYFRPTWNQLPPSSSGTLMDSSIGSMKSFNRSTGSFSESFHSMSDQDKSVLLEKLIIEQRERESLISQMLGNIKFEDLSEEQKFKMNALRVQDFGSPVTAKKPRAPTTINKKPNPKTGVKKVFRSKETKGRRNCVENLGTRRTRDHNKEHSRKEAKAILNDKTKAKVIFNDKTKAKAILNDKTRKKIVNKGTRVVRKKVRFEKGTDECCDKDTKSSNVKKPVVTASESKPVSASQSEPAVSSDAESDKVKEKKVIEYETNEAIIARRQKDIEYGKNTVGYDRYIKLVPKKQRTKEHPKTPPFYIKNSRRGWDGMVKLWRKRLHFYDPEDAHRENSEAEDSNKPKSHEVEKTGETKSQNTEAKSVKVDNARNDEIKSKNTDCKSVKVDKAQDGETKSAKTNNTQGAKAKSGKK